MNKEINPNDFGFEISIPMVMFMDKELDSSAIRLFAFVKGLTRAHGYCYATNGYLANLMDCCEKTVSSLLSKLSSLGYLEIQTTKHGINWQRHIFLSVGIKKSLRRVTDFQGGGKKFPGGWKNSSTIIDSSIEREDIEIKKIEKKEELVAPPPNPQNNSSLDELPKKVCDYLMGKIMEQSPNFTKTITPVWIKNTKKLLKLRTPTEIKTIIDWVFDDPFWSLTIESPSGLLNNIDRIEKQKRAKNKTSNGVKSEDDFIEKLKEKFKNDKVVTIGTNYLEINNGAMYPPHLSFSEKGFKEQALSLLRKNKISVDGL